MTIVVHDGSCGVKDCRDCATFQEMARRRFQVECFDEATGAFQPEGAPGALADFPEWEILHCAARLQLGQSFEVGGGAAPRFRTTRIQ